MLTDKAIALVDNKKPIDSIINSIILLTKKVIYNAMKLEIKHSGSQR